MNNEGFPFSYETFDGNRSDVSTMETILRKDRNKMERRLGKIQARHPQVNDLYDLALRDTAEGVRLFWEIKEDRKNWRVQLISRTNLTSGSLVEVYASEARPRSGP